MCVVWILGQARVYPDPHIGYGKLETSVRKRGYCGNPAGWIAMLYDVAADLIDHRSD